jgi:hypothetical protein
MATRSTITLNHGDGTYTSLYCHWDGYPDHNGEILKWHYNTVERVEALMALGDLSILGERLEPEDGETHHFYSGAEGVCLAYGRDRGDANTAARHYTSKAEFNLTLDRQEYNYVFDALEGTWSYFKGE